MLAFVVALAAIACDHLAPAQIRSSGEDGRGFAIAALAIGYAVVGLVVAFTVAFVAFVAAYFAFLLNHVPLS